ncbi:hypothetical protein BT69DRAFT_1355663 [Atractiella rhizophila]|nr:hypothetical protein BT69DRAFT_1355663 [Atractiella rhizophila]
MTALFDPADWTLQSPPTKTELMGMSDDAKVALYTVEDGIEGKEPSALLVAAGNPSPARYKWRKKSGWKLGSKTARNWRKVQERAVKKKAEEAEKNRQAATCRADLEKAAALMKEAESRKKGVATEEAVFRSDDAKSGKKDKKAETAADMER